MPFLKHEDIVLAYTAGLIDGEGSIMIIKTASPSTLRKHTFILKVVIANTNRQLVDWVKLHFGGDISCQIPKKIVEKPIFYWRVTAKQAYNFLLQIEPYLIIKNNQAKLALEFQKDRGKGKTKLSDNEWQVNETQRLTMKELNKKGVH